MMMMKKQRGRNCLNFRALMLFADASLVRLIESVSAAAGGGQNQLDTEQASPLPTRLERNS